MYEEATSKSKRKPSLTLLLFLFAIVAILFIVFFLKNPSPSSSIDDPEITELSGEKFEFDDFYHAKDGMWRLESTIYLLKERKYISGEGELADYLIYKANPNQIVRIKDSKGRWKLIEAIEEDSVIATGWADVNRKNAKKLE